MSLRSSSMSGFTDDLVEEILARVPTTSLQRLRSTCKKWNTLFNDPKFIRNHFDKVGKEYLNLMLSENRLFWMSVNRQGLHHNTDPSAIELKGELSLDKFRNNSDDFSYFNVFHCNGFLLCTNKSTTVVWNPCTGQTKWIQTKSANTRYHEYALGYVNKKSGHNYKILRFLTHETFELEIFEFNCDSWRVSGSVNPNFKLKIGGGMSVKGNTYWITSGNEVGCHLISFDFTTERFGSPMSLPCQDYFDTLSLYSIREERLSMLFKNDYASKIEIWLTNDIGETNDMSWSKFLCFDYDDNHQFLNGVSFFIDEKNELAVLSEYEAHDYGIDTDTFLVYIIGENRHRIVSLGDELHYELGPHMFSYVPSLVQI